MSFLSRSRHGNRRHGKRRLTGTQPGAGRYEGTLMEDPAAETPPASPPVPAPMYGPVPLPYPQAVPPRRRRAWVPAAPRPVRPAETMPFPVHGDPDSPYVPPARPVPPPSRVRDGVLLTSRASSLRFGIRCLCQREHVNTNADTFYDLYASAQAAGWREDRYRTWRCPRCARRAVFGVPPVAAIEAGAA